MMPLPDKHCRKVAMMLMRLDSHGLESCSDSTSSTGNLFLNMMFLFSRNNNLLGRKNFTTRTQASQLKKLSCEDVDRNITVISLYFYICITRTVSRFQGRKTQCQNASIAKQLGEMESKAFTWQPLVEWIFFVSVVHLFAFVS
jgi:hypothetical protein